MTESAYSGHNQQIPGERAEFRAESAYSGQNQHIPGGRAEFRACLEEDSSLGPVDVYLKAVDIRDVLRNDEDNFLIPSKIVNCYGPHKEKLTGNVTKGTAWPKPAVQTVGQAGAGDSDLGKQRMIRG